ncbi:MAG: HTH domain-containing protein [Candidatus Zixiibacteriota bacterium]
MSKTDRILSLLSLLSHRRDVSLDVIEQTIGVPRRTAYRYLNSLSEANVPLYFDKNTGGYRLTRALDIAPPAFTDNEVIVLTAVLMVTRQHLNPIYRTTLDSLAAKLCVRRSLPLERIVETHREMTQVHAIDPDFSAEITTAVLQVAVSKEWNVELVRAGSPRSQKVVSLSNPRLTFNRYWRLSGRGPSGNEEIDLRSILHATIAMP